MVDTFLACYPVPCRSPVLKPLQLHRNERSRLGYLQVTKDLLKEIPGRRQAGYYLAYLPEPELGLVMYSDGGTVVERERGDVH